MNYFWGSSTTEKSKSESPEPVVQSTNKKLRCRIGPNSDCLTTYNVNDESVPHFVNSSEFVGQIVVRVKDFNGITSDGSPPISSLSYFNEKKRQFSIQLSGRFKKEITAEDLLFGAEFDRKVSPPTGAWIAMKFANLIDPALTTDMYAEKPWLFSPFLCAMNIVNVENTVTPLPNDLDDQISCESTNIPSHPTSKKERKDIPKKLFGDWVWRDNNELVEDNLNLFPAGEEREFASDDIAARRKYFQKQKNRNSLVFKQNKMYHFEIFAPFIDFNTFDLSLGINVNLLRYLENQPIRLVAKSRSLDKPLFVIEFDLIDEDATDGNVSEADSVE